MDTIGSLIDKIYTNSLKSMHFLMNNKVDDVQDLSTQKDILIKEINNVKNEDKIPMLQHKTY